MELSDQYWYNLGLIIFAFVLKHWTVSNLTVFQGQATNQNLSKYKTCSRFIRSRTSKYLDT